MQTALDAATARLITNPFDAMTGFSSVVGRVIIPSLNGLASALTGISFSSDLSDMFSAIADVNGNYQVLVPLGDPLFNYSKAKLTAFDPISSLQLGSRTLDLSGMNSRNPFQVTPLVGDACVDDDDDDDDPDCDF